MDARHYIACDLCGTPNPRFVLSSPGLDGPLVECVKCGLRYVGERRSALTFGTRTAEEVTSNVRSANQSFRHLRLEEEQRLALLNARWRLDLIRRIKSRGKLLEIGCARGDFLSVARELFEASGVEPNPELADDASRVAPVHRDVIERTPWSGFDVIASFHVIEHADSPRSFIHAAVERLNPSGLLVIETPDIDSLPFKILRSRWRQFIPEHYFFFTKKTMSQLMVSEGLQVQRVTTIGKYASLDLITNRLSRYMPWLPNLDGFSRFTFRFNPRDIILMFAIKR
jgi:2-polyprenyl-3-methyl-5-hydroxy-6-metoxy-1,4-benzoquinol methylase